MQSLKDIQQSAKFDLSILVFGPPKCGKTHFAGTYTKGPIYVFNFDQGGYKTLLKSDNPSIYIESFFDTANRPSDKPMAWANFNQSLHATLKDIDLEAEPLLVFDSTTAMAEACINYVLGNNNRYLTAKGEPINPQLQDWGTAGKLMAQLYTAITNAPIASLFCGHVRMEKDEISGSALGFPTSIGKTFSSQQARYFDEVYYMEATNGRYMTHTRGFRMFQSGSRINGLSPKEENLTLDHVYNLYKNGGK